ncbi:MAG: hypothetical protein ACM3N7_01745, partial [Planctomycetaceae bacterium]
MLFPSENILFRNDIMHLCKKGNLGTHLASLSNYQTKNIYLERGKRRLIVKKGLILAVMVLITLVAVPSVQAIIIVPDETATYSFTSQHCTGGCGPFPDGSSYGTVTLNQFGTDASAYTDVTVHLLAPLMFVSTGAGAGYDFLFNPTGVSVGDISITQNAPYTLYAYEGPFHADGTGDLGFGIGNIVDQPNGAPGAFSSDIIFQVTGATIGDLTHANVLGNIFVADIYNPGWTTQEAPNGVT